MSPLALSIWAGFAIGVAFGATGQRTGFCLNSGLRGLFVTGDHRKISAFIVAMAVAILATQSAEAFGVIDLRKSIYLNSTLSWLVLPLGGLIFGYGMIMANACGARSLVLVGQGNLRQLVVLLFLGIAAFAMLTGVFAPARLAVTSATSIAFDYPPSLPRYLEGALGARNARLLPAIAISALLFWLAFRNTPFRKSPRDIFGGLIIGLLIAAGWLATGYLGADDFEPAPIASLTFVAPIGESIQYLMLATGMKFSFGLAVVSGLLVGALGSALLAGDFKVEGFTKPDQMVRYISGGLLMGVGGAMALGCSIGEGLTGLSTLAFCSFLAVTGIFAGAAIALRGPLRLPELHAKTAASF